MEPTALIGVPLSVVAVDGGGDDGIVPAAADDNDNTMVLASMVSSTNGGGGNGNLAGNVANMSRHVADDTPCRSNFGQMGPCRRHYFFDVVAVSLCRLEPTFTRFFGIRM